MSELCYRNLLPEFNDGRAALRQLLTRQVTEAGVANGAILALIMAEDLDAGLAVPGIVTGWPGKCSAEGLHEVVEAPGQHHDVIGVAEEHYDHWGIA